MEPNNKYNEMILSKRSEQLDAPALDAYLASLLRVEELALYFPKPLQTYFPFLRECLIPTITVLQCLGHTPARRVLGLEMTSSSSHPIAITSTINPRRQFIAKLFLYTFISFWLQIGNVV